MAHWQANWQAIRQWLSGDWPQGPLSEQTAALTGWFRSPRGRLLQASEQRVLDELLPSLFGYHALQLSINESADLMGSSPIHHRVQLISRCDSLADCAQERKSLLLADFDALPLDSDSVDLVILHHVLEFSPHPHQILKEVSRVLIPRGHLVIVGFNPFSLTGLWKALLSRFSAQQQWRYREVTPWRLQDWFKFLDLGACRRVDTFHRPPFNSPLLLNRFAFVDRLARRWRLPGGGAYVMLARKEVVAMTPIRAPWEKLSRRLPTMTAARPSTPRQLSPRSVSPRQLH